MKKMIHIAVVPVLTALLAACAAPVEQGRLDQIEEATTALADRTLMEGLRDDFEEVRKQLEEAKGQATVEQQELMAELQDDFQEVEKQLGEVGKQTNLAAELALADGLKKKLESLAAKLNDVKPEEEEEVLHREVTYNILNLDAVDVAKLNRMKYASDLEEAFKRHQTMGYKLILARYLHKKEADPSTEKWSKKINPDKGWEFAGAQFKLSDLEKGIPEPTLDEIEKFIKTVTDTNAVGIIKGTPVVRKADPPKPVIFKTLAVNYISTSGEPLLEHTWKCDPQELELQPFAKAKQPNADAYMKLPGRTIKPWKDSESFFFPTSWDEKAHRCVVDKGEKRTAYVMVLLREGEERGLSVAEYHTITARIPHGMGSPKPQITKNTEEGRLTQEIPACPPKSWGTERDAFIAFLNGRCTDDP